MKSIFILIAFLQIHVQAVNSKLIDNKQTALLKQYQLESSYLEEFPFSEYQIINSFCQGKFYIDGCDYIKGVLAAGHIWEPEIAELIKRYVKPNTIVIDVGAHIGTHTMMLSRCVQNEGVVIAFEPQAKLCRELSMNLQLNQCANVIPIHCALGTHSGVVYLEPVRPNNEGYRCITSKRPTEQVALVMLDAFQLTPVSCIKIDAESYELEVLKGAYHTIMNNKPVIIIEIGGGWSREQEENINPKQYLKDVMDLLENVFNYRIVAISTVTGDYLAIPKTR